MANKCEETGESIANGMAQLLGRIQGLSGAGMAGQANSALQSVSVQLNDGLTKVLSALDELGAKMTSASSTYGFNDSDAAADIQAAGDATGNSFITGILTNQPTAR